MSRNAATGLVKPMAVGLGPLLIALAIVAAGSALISMTEGLMPTVWADEPSVLQLGNLPEGEITAVGSTTVDVAGRLYGLHPKLTIVSDEGQPMELQQLRPGLVIQYHVKEGALDRIIVLIPR
jgi:hypothetical protein